MSKRVALTITSPASASPIDGVGDASCPRATSGAIVNQIPTSQSPRQFFFHITSFLHFFERRTCLAEPHGPRLSFSFLRRSFFARGMQKVGSHRPPLQCTRTNEVDRTNILAPGFWLRKA